MSLGPFLSFVSLWTHVWRRRMARGADFRTYTSEDVDLIACELGLLAEPPPVMRVFRLNVAAVASSRPDIFHLLQKVCATCVKRGRCVNELSSRPIKLAFDEYCPKAETLSRLIRALAAEGLPERSPGARGQ